MLVDATHRRAEQDAHSLLLQRMRGAAAETRGERCEHAITGFDEHDGHFGKVDAPIVLGQDMLDELAQRTRVLDAGWSRSDDRERQQPPSRICVGDE